MYEFNSRVRYSEIDHHGTLTLPALINYFQDCSTFQSEDVGLGTEVLKAEKRAWILSGIPHWEKGSRSEHFRQNLRGYSEIVIFT